MAHDKEQKYLLRRLSLFRYQPESERSLDIVASS
jgi:hypothetical protein